VKIKTLISKLKEIENYKMQSFWDKAYEGACPCFSGQKTVEGKTIGFWGRCWRVSEYQQDLHVFGTMTIGDKKIIAKEVKRALDAQEWYSDYTLIFDKT